MSVRSLMRAIPNGDRVLLDTTVLAAFLDASDAAHPVARHVVGAMVQGGRNPAVVSMITVMDLVRPLRASPPGHHTVLAFLRTHPGLTCVPIDVQIAQGAAHLRADNRFSPPDALIVGTGLATQVGHIATNDQTWTGKLAKMAERIKVL